MIVKVCSLVVWGSSSETYTAGTPFCTLQVYRKKSPKANHLFLIMEEYIAGMKTPMQMLTLKPSQYDTGPKIESIFKAADWIHSFGMLVPCAVRIDGRLTRSGGNYGRGLVKVAASQTRSLAAMEGILVHEFVHAYQDKEGYMNMRGYKGLQAKFDSYLNQGIEIEAFWWQNEFMKDVYGHEISQAASYRRLGVKEFE